MHALAQRFEFAEGSILAGKYQIVRRIGVGGMGEVYEARHVRMDKRLAIKALGPSLANNPESVTRFVREAEAASRLRHPNVIDVFDVDESCDPPFMVMEYLDGCSLQSLVERGGALSIRCCATLLLPVLRAIQAAHELNIIHRDLKPDNIFVAVCGDQSVRPVVLDFGIAKVADSVVASLMQTRVVLGTVMYMSPEQITNSSTVTPASDQYALGAIAYECVAGRVAFGGESIAEVFDSIRAGQYPKLSTVVPSVDPEFEAVVRRAMAVDPNERFPSIAEFANAIAPFACRDYDEVAAELAPVRALRRSPSSVAPIAGALRTVDSINNARTSPARLDQRSAMHARIPDRESAPPDIDLDEAESAPRESTRASSRWALPVTLAVVIAALASVVGFQRHSMRSGPAPMQAARPATVREQAREAPPRATPELIRSDPNAPPNLRAAASATPPDAGASASQVTTRRRNTPARPPVREQRHVGGGFVL